MISLLGPDGGDPLGGRVGEGGADDGEGGEDEGPGLDPSHEQYWVGLDPSQEFETDPPTRHVAVHQASSMPGN